MKADTFLLVKSFGIGFILGYIIGYILRKAFSIGLVIAALAGLTIYFTDLWEHLNSIWSLTNILALPLLTSTMESINVAAIGFFSSDTKAVGFVIGFVVSFLRKS